MPDASSRNRSACSALMTPRSLWTVSPDIRDQRYPPGTGARKKLRVLVALELVDEVLATVGGGLAQAVEDRVGAGAAVHGHVRLGRRGEDRVVAGTGVEAVRTVTAGAQRVVAVAADQHVARGAALDEIVAGAADQPVGAGAAVDRVVARAAVDEIVSAVATTVGVLVGPEVVVAAEAVEAVRSVPAVEVVVAIGAVLHAAALGRRVADPDRRVVRAVGKDDVLAALDAALADAVARRVAALLADRRDDERVIARAAVDRAEGA